MTASQKELPVNSPVVKHLPHDFRIICYGGQELDIVSISEHVDTIQGTNHRVWQLQEQTNINKDYNTSISFSKKACHLSVLN